MKKAIVVMTYEDATDDEIMDKIKRIFKEVIPDVRRYPVLIRFEITSPEIGEDGR